jgi:hypothetical protein
MADQDKDRTNPAAGQKAGPNISGSNLSSNTQQRTGAADTSVGSGAGSSGSLGGGSTGAHTSSSMSGATGSADNLKDAGRRTVDEAKQYTKNMADSAKEQGRSMLEGQKDSAAAQVDSAAHAFRDTAKQLQGEGQSQASRYVGMFAEQLESLGGQLRHKNMDTLIRDAEDLGRRSPGVFLAGSVVAGFLLARFLKSSTEHRNEQTDMSYDDQRSHSPYAGDSSGVMADAYRSAGSNAGSASQTGQALTSGTPGNASGGSSSGVSGASNAGSTGTTIGNTTRSSAISSTSSAVGADGTGTGDKATPSPNSTASKPGGNTYGTR